MLSRLIMYLCGDYDSWDQRSLMIGMMGMGGMGMGMGGMGGGMGGMGMGGMGGGMRSVPPTGPFETTLQPAPGTSLANDRRQHERPRCQFAASGSGRGRNASGQRHRPVDRRQTDDHGSETAWRRPRHLQTIAQMVIWYVTAGAGWDDIGRLSQGWGNASEIALAHRFVARLARSDEHSPGQGRSGPAFLGDQSGSATEQGADRWLSARSGASIRSLA